MQTENKRGRFRPVVILMAAALLGIAWQAGPSSAGDKPPLKIGVLATRGPEQCLKSWTPTAEYLTRQIAGQRFAVVPLSHEQVYPAVETASVDFVLVNSAFYVGVERRYRANRIVTLKERRANEVYTRYGGVIFCRRDRSDIRELADLHADENTKMVALVPDVFLPAGVTKGGQIIVPLAVVDHMCWTKHVAALFEGLVKQKNKLFKKSKIVLLVSGTLSERTRKELTKRGIGHSEKVAFDDIAYVRPHIQLMGVRRISAQPVTIERIEQVTRQNASPTSIECSRA